MRLLIILILWILPVSLMGQVSTTLENSGYYYVVVGADTISQHNRLDKAIESGTSAVPDGNFQIVQDFRMSVNSFFSDSEIITLPPDTVYADTLMVPVYATHEPAHHALFKEVDFSMSHDSLGSNRRIHFVIETQENSVDTLYTEIRCGTEWVENNVFVNPAQTFQYGILWNCSSPLTYQFRAVNELGWSETIINSYPLWMTDYQMPGSQAVDTMFVSTDFTDSPKFTPTWGSLTYTISSGQLSIMLSQRNIARIRWDEVPSHKNIRTTITEVVDSTHSTGIHLGLRSSESPLQGAVETYLKSDGMGVSIFSDGQWSNPHTFPVQWEYDVPITYTVTLIDDLITVQTGTDVYNYRDPLIDAVPSGTLMIGSTGAGFYYVNDIEVEVID